MIEKALVEKQLSFLLNEMRQKSLTIPQRIGAKLRAGSRDETTARPAAAVAKEVVHETLEVCADLPLKVTDPDWLERLEEEG